ncbi:MAG: general stress protein [Alkalibacterium sp.]|nr:general stress protein [Alkalibacterium sp.]
MNRTTRKVLGSYNTRDEALNVVDRLQNDGYQKQDIIIYANDPETLGDHEAVDVATEDGRRDDTQNDTDRDRDRDDRSMWDKVKDAFTPDSYDHEEEKKRDDYNTNDDILYPYRDDLADGKYVIAVENAEGKDLEQYDTSDALLNSNRKTDDPNDPLTEGREYDREQDKDNFKN